LIALHRHHRVMKIEFAAAAITDHVAPDQSVALFRADKKGTSLRIETAQKSPRSGIAGHIDCNPDLVFPLNVSALRLGQ
jgi:hypothetical protein